MKKRIVIGAMSVFLIVGVALAVYFIGGFGGKDSEPPKTPTPSYVQSEKSEVYASRRPQSSSKVTSTDAQTKSDTDSVDSDKSKSDDKSESKPVVDHTKASSAAGHSDANNVVLPQAGNVVDESVISALGGPDAIFSVQEIPDDIFARMKGKSFRDDCTIPRGDLRYLKMLHVNAEGKTLVGEMVVASSVADEVLDIFRQLYDAKWPIKKMVLVDNYDADDDASCADGNTAAFNYREVTGGSTLSNHAYGLAIDINTFENPYVVSGSYVFPADAERFADRSLQEPYMIHEGDLCWRLFTERGWSWGGSWSTPKDYQHFEKM